MCRRIALQLGSQAGRRLPYKFDCDGRLWTPKHARWPRCGRRRAIGQLAGETPASVPLRAGVATGELSLSHMDDVSCVRESGKQTIRVADVRPESGRQSNPAHTWRGGDLATNSVSLHHHPDYISFASIIHH